MVTEYTKICAICGKPYVEVHHLVFGRGKREKADEDGLTIPLCRDCHEKIHKIGIAGSLSKIIGQLWYELNLVNKGIPPAMARQMFRERYGISYL